MKPRGSLTDRKPSLITEVLRDRSTSPGGGCSPLHIDSPLSSGGEWTPKNSPGTSGRTRSMEGFEEWTKSSLLEAAHLVAEGSTPGGTPKSGSRTPNEGTPKSSGSGSPGLGPSAPPASVFGGSLQLQRSVTDDVLRRRSELSHSVNFDTATKKGRGSINGENWGGSSLLEQAQKAEAAEASLAIAKLRTDHEVQKVMDEIRAEKPVEEPHRLLLKALEAACQTILDLQADQMDRSRFYSVVATLQGMVSTAGKCAPAAKHLVSKALFTTSRCSRLLQYMDIKETTMALSSTLASPLENARRGTRTHQPITGTLPTRMAFLTRSDAIRAGSVPVELGKLGRSPGDDGGSSSPPEQQSGWVRVNETSRRDIVSMPWIQSTIEEPSAEYDADAELGRRSMTWGTEGRHSFDAMRHSFDDLEALRVLLDTLKENNAQHKERSDSVTSLGKPMQCHICDKHIFRECFEEHTELCVGKCQIDDTLRNCDKVLYEELMKIGLLVGVEHAGKIKSPTSKLKHKHRRNNSFSRVLDASDITRFTEARVSLGIIDYMILDKFKEVCEDAHHMLEKCTDTDEFCDALLHRLDDAVKSGTEQMGTVPLPDSLKQLHDRISKTVSEKKSLHGDMAQLILKIDSQIASQIPSPQSTNTRSRGASTSRDGISVSAEREKKVSIKDFDVLKHISHGAYGAVFLAKKKNTGDYFAIKKLKKDHMVRKKQVEHVMRERNIMAMTNNPFLVKLYYTFQSKGTLYFGMEFCQGGDLASLLKVLGGFETEMIRGYAGEMVLALEYLKSQMIVHRDLKPDNILVASDGHIKLTDFGLSYGALVENVLGGTLDLYDEMGGRGEAPSEEEMAKPTAVDKGKKNVERFSEVGTPDYLAPEILTGIGHSYPVDYWALGVMMYEFYMGLTPFTGPNLGVIFQRITSCDIEWMDEPAIPEDGKDFIARLLTIDPEERIGSGANGIANMKSHIFFAGVDFETLLERAPAFVPDPDNAADTGYFAEKSDEENIAKWSTESSESISSTEFGDFEEYAEGSGDEEITSPDQDAQFLGFSFRNLDHLKGLNIAEAKRERDISEDGVNNGQTPPLEPMQSPPQGQSVSPHHIPFELSDL